MVSMDLRAVTLRFRLSLLKAAAAEFLILGLLHFLTRGQLVALVVVASQAKQAMLEGRERQSKDLTVVMVEHQATLALTMLVVAAVLEP
jgi:hypothetical protein